MLAEPVCMHTPYVPQQITVINAQIYQGIPAEVVLI